MPVATELDLPLLDITRDDLRGAVYQREMRALEGHDGWLARSPFGFVTLDRESGELFLRSRSVVFPSLALLQLFGITDGPLYEEITRNIISLSGADHARLRSLVNPALAPRRIERYRPAMRRCLDQLLTPVGDGARVEFVGDLAKPYPSRVIAHVMGAPPDDAPMLHRFSGEIQKQFDARVLADPSQRAAVERVVADCYAYVERLIAERRGRSGEDLITDLIEAEEDGERLNTGELRDLVLNILVGGVDTSQSQLAHAVRLLSDRPDQWQLLRSDPARLAPQAVLEALRYEPITPFTARLTTDTIEHRGVSFPAGTIVMVSAWHANRDGVPDPDRFDITAPREGGRVLTFGAGIHYCVGANLARAEIEEGLARLATEFTAIEPDGEPAFGTPSGIYGLSSLPLRLRRR